MLAADDLDHLGWCRFPEVLTPREIISWRALIPDETPGVRLPPNTIRFPDRIEERIRGLRIDPTPLRITGFNKSEAVNWSLPWHQDRAIGKDRNDLSGAELMRRVFLHIALDDSHPDHGALELAEGSHKQGIVTADLMDEVISRSEIATPAVRTGEILLVCALTLHRSSAVAKGLQRRAIRIDLSEA